jgi:transcriptional regulator with XRE-family HTH domain
VFARSNFTEVVSVTLGQRIRELRMKKGLTQIELAKGICTPTMVSQIESDKARPAIGILNPIAERLGVTVDRLLTDVEMNLETVSTYKMSRLMIAAREYSSAIPLLEELLETNRGKIATEDVLFELAECYLHSKEFEKADQALRKLQELAILKHDQTLLVLIFKNMGVLEYQRHNHLLALDKWQKALEEAEKIDHIDPLLKGTLLFNLSLASTKIGRIREAVSYFEMAEALYSETGNPEVLAKVYLGLSHSYRRLNHLGTSARYAERAAALYELSGCAVSLA